MKPYVIERHADVPLEFDGRVIAELDNDEPGRSNWNVIRIYETSTGKFVVEQLGMTRVRGQRTYRTVSVHDTPAQVREGLKRDEGGRRYLTHIALDVLDEAAENHPAFRGMTSQPERI